MKLTFYSDPAEFYPLAYPFLIKEEVRNNLPIAILNKIRDNPRHYGEDPELIALWEDDEVCYVSIRTPPHNQILPYTVNLHYVDAVAQYCVESRRAISGVLAEPELALTFAQIWVAAKGGKSQPEMKERIYELVVVNPTTLGNHSFRPIEPRDFDLLAGWIQNFAVEALGESRERTDSLERIKSKHFTPDQLVNFYVLDDAGQVVSMAHQGGRTPTGQIINLVYSPPEFRKRGYATECVAKLSQLSLDQGFQRCLLFTDLANPTSNKIYQHIGYRPVCDIDVFKFTAEA